MLIGLLCLVTTTSARAQVGVSALSSHYQVPWLEEPTRRVRLGVSVGYGITGDILKQSDTHHRVLGAAALGIHSRLGISGEARLDARYDAHKLQNDDDSGGVLDPRFALRYARKESDLVSWGGQLGLWIPGKDFPSPAFEAVSLDVSALLTVHANERNDLSLRAGFRVDRSAEAIDHPERLSPSDFSAIGLSSSHAVLVGLGFRHDYGSGAFLSELAADILVGSDAPSFTKSPIYASAGIEQRFNASRTRLQVLANVALSSRPAIDVTGPLIPLLPRAWLVLGVTHDMWLEAQETPASVEEPFAVTEPTETPQLEPTPPPLAALEEPVGPRGVIRVVVRDTDWGEPLEASITVFAAGEEEPATTGRTTKLSEGMIELPVAPGRYEVLIEAKGYASQRRKLSVDEEGVTVLNVDLRPRGKP